MRAIRPGTHGGPRVRSSGERSSTRPSRRSDRPTLLSLLSLPATLISPVSSLIYTRYIDATRTYPPGGHTCIYALKRPPRVRPLVRPSTLRRCPFGSCASYNIRVAALPTGNRGTDDSLCLMACGVLSPGVAGSPRRCACGARARAYRPPHTPARARRLTEGRSLPGDSTLVCAAYHQFPLILNRIQRTKPAARTPRPPPRRLAPVCT